MTLAELLIIAVGVSMDAFAVSICKGLSAPDLRPRNALTAGLWFGGFQALMPVVGYYIGNATFSASEKLRQYPGFSSPRKAGFAGPHLQRLPGKIGNANILTSLLR